jgi:hypothetical protein
MVQFLFDFFPTVADVLGGLFHGLLRLAGFVGLVTNFVVLLTSDLCTVLRCVSQSCLHQFFSMINATLGAWFSSSGNFLSILQPNQ